MRIVVERLELAFVVKAVEGIFLALDVVDKDDAIDVVYLVLDNARQEAFGLDADFVAIRVEGFDTDFAPAFDAAVAAFDAQAAFEIFDLLALVFDDFGVDERRELAGVFVLEAAADDDDTLQAVNLYCGQGSADFVRTAVFPVKAGACHVGDEGVDSIGDDVDFGGFLAQVRVWQRDDGFFFHCLLVYHISDEKGIAGSLENHHARAIVTTRVKSGRARTASSLVVRAGERRVGLGAMMI